MHHTDRGVLRVLHIEDDGHDCELIAHRLARQGLHCAFLVASCEAEVSHALVSASFDVILSDYTLPQFSGMAALKLAKEKRPDVPFIFVSGTIGEERAIESLRAGAADYVLKDRLDRLAAAMRRAVSEARRDAEHAQAIAALRESEERFRQVTANIEEVLWLVDVEPRRVVYVSPAYERIWGRPCRELYTTPRAWLECVHPEDRHRVEIAFTQQAVGHYDIDYRIVRPNGVVRWVNDRAFPVRNSDGIVYRLAGVAQDITTKKNLEQEVSQAGKMEALGQFAGGIAHDFNNVLAVVQLQTYLLLADPELTAKFRAGAENIMAAAVRAANLTRQLLTFSRREASQAREIDLGELLSSTTQLLRRIVGEHIAVETRFPPGLPAVRADPVMMEQILMNLVLNARDAMPNGGRLDIMLSLEDADMARVASHAGVSPGRFLCMLISDSGSGIPPDILPRIFEPFFTTKESGCGTGLGLATVARIVTHHHGWIEVHSGNGVGTTFRVYLPALDRPAPKTPEASVSPPRGHGERVLLVEDDEAVRAMARLVLESFGYRVVEATTASAALDHWEAYGRQFDLLVTDLILPGGASGSDVARQFTSARPDVCVLYTSGYTPDIVARHVPAKEDAPVILQKPFSADALLQSCATALKKGKRCADS